MKQHVCKVAAACFYQLRHLRQIRRRVEQDVTIRLVMTLVTSRGGWITATRFWQIYRSRQSSRCNEFKTPRRV